tara:strand:- start:9072 stop:9347 length:276 start_codon:yes stop_codon:yes gene_type:complete
MFRPVNRYIQIEIPDEKPIERSSGIVLPEDYEPKKDDHIVTAVLAWATDVRFSELLNKNCQIIVNRSMIEEITTSKEKFNVILDNYVIGII